MARTYPLGLLSGLPVERSRAPVVGRDVPDSRGGAPEGREQPTLLVQASPIDWPDTLRRLTVYASLLFGVDDVMLGTGKSPADLAAGVVLEFLEGTIVCDIDKPILPPLKKALFRDFLDLRKSAGRRSTMVFDIDREGGENDVRDLASPDVPLSDPLLRKALKDAIGNDGDLRELADTILERVGPPRDLAKALNTTPSDIENRRRRLRRALMPLRKMLGD